MPHCRKRLQSHYHLIITSWDIFSLCSLQGNNMKKKKILPPSFLIQSNIRMDEGLGEQHKKVFFFSVMRNVWNTFHSLRLTRPPHFCVVLWLILDGFINAYVYSCCWSENISLWFILITFKFGLNMKHIWPWFLQIHITCRNQQNKCEAGQSRALRFPAFLAGDINVLVMVLEPWAKPTQLTDWCHTRFCFFAFLFFFFLLWTNPQMLIVLTELLTKP